MSMNMNPNFDRTLSNEDVMKRRASLLQRLHIDGLLLLLLLVLGAAGLFVLYSASGKSWDLLLKQASSFGLGLVMMFVIAQIEPRFLARWVPLGYLIGVLLLVVVDVMGHNAMGATRWINIPGVIRFQPSEFMKIIMPATIAWYLSKRTLPPHLKHVAISLVLIGVPFILIVRQPACAHFVSQQLAEYFIDDRPSPALVDAMAHTFQRSDGDIAAVLRTMLLSKEAAAVGGRKFKDPMRFLVSAMRLAYDGQPVPNAVPLVNWLRQMGEPLYGRITPDGWPLDSASWTGSGQMSKRFDFARVLGSGRNRLFADDDGGTNAANDPPPDAPDLQDSALYRNAIAPRLSDATRNALAQAKSPMEWNTFLLSSPDFNYR